MRWTRRSRSNSLPRSKYPFAKTREIFPKHFIDWKYNMGGEGGSTGFHEVARLRFRAFVKNRNASRICYITTKSRQEIIRSRAGAENDLFYVPHSPQDHSLEQLSGLHLDGMVASSRKLGKYPDISKAPHRHRTPPPAPVPSAPRALVRYRRPFRVAEGIERSPSNITLARCTTMFLLFDLARAVGCWIR